MKIYAILIVSMLGIIGICMPLATAGTYDEGFYLSTFEINNGPIQGQEFDMKITVRHTDSSATVYYAPIISHYNIRIGEDDGDGGFFTTWTNQNIYRNDNMFYWSEDYQSAEWKIIGIVDDLVNHNADRIRISFKLYDTSNNVVAEDSKAWNVQITSSTTPPPTTSPTTEPYTPAPSVPTTQPVVIDERTTDFGKTLGVLVMIGMIITVAVFIFAIVKTVSAKKPPNQPPQNFNYPPPPTNPPNYPPPPQG